MDNLPRISIVTPSYNQGRYLQQTMQSILDQQYPNLEYIVMDGGSTDNSVDIIRKYEKHLAYWTSDKDAGQYDALNKGFARSTGSIMAWLNSDDMYVPWALQTVADVFTDLPQVNWLTTFFPMLWNDDDRAMACRLTRGFSRQMYLRGGYLPGRAGYARNFIQQESTFWRRSLWDEAGGRLNTDFSLAADFELWGRFFQHAPLHAVGLPLGGFRVHEADDQRTRMDFDRYLDESMTALAQLGGRVLPRVQWGTICALRRLMRGPLRPLAIRWRIIDQTPKCTYSRQLGRWDEVIS